MEIHTIQPFLSYFGNVRERTMRVARCIPPDKIDWTHAPGKFTLGDILRHLAVAERYMWGENVQCRPARYSTHGKELADGYENVMAFLERMHAESMQIFARLTDEDLQRKCKTPDNAPITIWKWLRLMPEHENPPPRADLSLSGDAWGKNAAALRFNVRASSRAQCYGLN
jgi:uncharacterized damage-inducible protein DinB